MISRTEICGLVFLILIGVGARLHHFDFPSIGLHNAKENDYLSQAEHDYRDGIDFTRHAHVLDDDGSTPQEEYPQAPLLSSLIVLFWKIFGVGFWQARLVILLLSLAGTLMIYFLARDLLRSKLPSFLVALVFTCLPVVVFYGRNIQPDLPALSVALLGMWMALHPPLKRSRVLFFVLFGFIWSFVFILKAPWVILLLPTLALVPKFSKKDATLWGLCFLCFILLPLSFILLTQKGHFAHWKKGTVDRISFLSVFQFDYWRAYFFSILGFLKAAFSFDILILALGGICVLFFSHQNLKLRKFILFYVVSIPIFAILMSDYIRQHDYYFAPFAPLVAFLCIYFLNWLKESTATRFPAYSKWTKTIPFFILFLCVPNLVSLRAKHFDQIYFGLDAAADFLKLYAKSTDKLWIIGHAQSFGVCYNSDRQCSAMPVEAQTLEHQHFEWLLIYKPKAEFITQAQLDYANQNFNLKAIGYGPMRDATTLIPSFFLYGRKEIPIDSPEIKLSSTYSYSISEGNVVLEMVFPKK